MKHEILCPKFECFSISHCISETELPCMLLLINDFKSKNLLSNYEVRHRMNVKNLQNEEL